MAFKILTAVLRFIQLFIFRIKIVGKENIPTEGGAIAAINHRSNWDVIIVGSHVSRKLGYMAKSELFKNKIFGALIKSLGAFPVHRGKGDLGAIKAALTKLRGGEIIVIFPEGRRVKDNENANAKAGAVMLATRAGVPIIPIKISGKMRWMSKVTVTIGKPISYEEYSGQKVSVEVLHALSDELMHTIRNLDGANKTDADK